jgi:uncharacterized membrane protein
MPIEYSEQDTEQVRQAEGTSAGMPTQSLGPAPVVGPPMAPARGVGDRNNLLALALIAGGALMLFGYLPNSRMEIEGGLILLTIASCFLFFAFWKRIYGLLIPGSILAGLSVGVTFADITNGVSVLWGLALGFLMILFLGRALFNQRSNWPVFPAVPLFAVGVIVAVASLPSILSIGVMWLPLLLIGAGLYLGWGRGH